MNLRERLRPAVARLTEAGVENPPLDAELLLAEAVGISRVQVLTSDFALDGPTEDRFERMLQRRVRREPLAYILGRKEFYGVDLEITRDVLIPRPETETLVAAALEWLSAKSAARVLDLGTGSGAIAIAIASGTSRVELVGCDRDETALTVARANAARLGLGERIEFRLADCFKPMDSNMRLGTFDLIISNPPYIPSREIAELPPEVSLWEPRIALDGGRDGLGFYRAIAYGAADHLTTNGAVFIEIGDNQSNAVATLFRKAGFSLIATGRDLAGLERIVSAMRRVHPAADQRSDKVSTE